MINLRPDLALISDWINPGAHVLDLGCGDGTLLKHLKETRQITGYGMEIDDDNIVKSLIADVDVIQTDLDKGLSEFTEHAFDYVIMSQTLQATRHPDKLLLEMLRVGHEGIVTFPNFGHWQVRLKLLATGRMPVSRTLPNQWYDTPNIHLCTLRDFEELCKKLGIKILERAVVDATHRTSLGVRLLPNLLGEIAIYRFRKGT